MVVGDYPLVVTYQAEDGPSPGEKSSPTAVSFDLPPPTPTSRRAPAPQAKSKATQEPIAQAERCRSQLQGVIAYFFHGSIAGEQIHWDYVDHGHGQYHKQSLRATLVQDDWHLLVVHTAHLAIFSRLALTQQSFTRPTTTVLGGMGSLLARTAAGACPAHGGSSSSA